ncbi:MAG: hypothetical protein H0X30_25330 [Anaerolineae bacterium]|nr:hypothetical protein [Anaerolineae bacterium]
MNNLSDVPPSGVKYSIEGIAFYFGAQPSNLHKLSGKSEFTVVYSPREGYNWEVVRYGLFDQKNGISVIDRRGLQADEKAYFENLKSISKLDTRTNSVLDGEDL